MDFVPSDFYPLDLTIVALMGDSVMQLIHNENILWNTMSVDEMQVMIRKRLSEGRAFYMSLILIAQFVISKTSQLEPCPICYCVMHPSTHTLPDVGCSHCVARFHSNCLASWFKSSQSRSCPICRQQIML